MVDSGRFHPETVIELSSRKPAGDALPPDTDVWGEEAFAIPASSIQESLWLVHQLNPSSPAYNLAHAFRLEGHLNVEALEKGLQEIVRRHEGLRTVFAWVEGRPTQIISPQLDLRLRVMDLSDLPGEERQAEAVPRV